MTELIFFSEPFTLDSTDKNLVSWFLINFSVFSELNLFEGRQFFLMRCLKLLPVSGPCHCYTLTLSLYLRWRRKRTMIVWQRFWKTTMPNSKYIFKAYSVSPVGYSFLLCSTAYLCDSHQYELPNVSIINLSGKNLDSPEFPEMHGSLQIPR